MVYRHVVVLTRLLRHKRTVHRFSTSKSKPAHKQYKLNVMKCHFCGKQHEMLKSKCPAYGKTCKACNQKKKQFSCSAKCHKKLTL